MTQILVINTNFVSTLPGIGVIVLHSSYTTEHKNAGTCNNIYQKWSEIGTIAYYNGIVLYTSTSKVLGNVRRLFHTLYCMQNTGLYITPYCRVSECSIGEFNEKLSGLFVY